MTDVVGRGTIELVVDARKVKAGIDDAKKSIRTLGEGQKDISAGASQSIDRYIGKLQQQNATLGMSTRETEIYKLALRGASNEQINAANATLRLAENHRATAGVVQALNAGLIAAATAGLAAAGGFAAMIMHSINAADHLNDLNKTTGISVENLAGLALAAEQSGGDLDGIAASISKLSVNIGKDGEKFKALGITAKDPLEAFKQLADIFVAIDDPQMRAALGAAALGKSWASAAPLLSEGGKRIGEMVTKGGELSKITEEVTGGADRFKDALAELKATAAGFGTKLAADMVGPLTEVTKAIQEAYAESGKLAGLWRGMGALGAFLFTDEFASARVKLKTLGEELQSLEQNQAGLAKNAPGGGVIANYLWGNKGDLEAQIAIKKAQIADLLKSTQPKPAAPKPTTDPKLAAGVAAFINADKTGAAGADTAKQELRAYTNELQKLEMELGRVNEMTVVQRVAYETTAGSLAALTGPHKAYLLTIAAEVDKRKEVLAVNKEDVAAYEAMFKVREQLGTIQAAANDATRDYLADLKFEASLIGKTADEQARMNEERKIELDLRTRLKAVDYLVGASPADRDAARAALERSAAQKREAIPGKLRTDAAGQNIADVDKIRESLMSQAQIEEKAYLDRMIALVTFRDAKIENEQSANETIEQLATQHADKMLAIKQSQEQQILSVMSGSADQLYGLMKQAGLDQTAIGRVAFIASKALAVAQILMSTEVAAITALLPPPLGLGPVAGMPFGAMIRGMGYTSAGLAAGLAIAEVAGGKASGGFVDAGKAYRVNERGPELLTTGGKDYLMMGGAGGSVTPNDKLGSGAINIINATTGRIDRASWVPMPSGERALLLEEAANTVAAQMADPNSKVSRSLGRNYATQRSR